MWSSSHKQHVDTTSVMETHKYVKQKQILAFGSGYTDLHECRHEKPEQRGLQVA